MTAIVSRRVCTTLQDDQPLDCAPLLFKPPHHPPHPVGARVVAGAVALGRLAPRRLADAALALAAAATVRVVHWVHGNAAHARPPPQPARRTRLAQLGVLVLRARGQGGKGEVCVYKCCIKASSTPNRSGTIQQQQRMMTTSPDGASNLDCRLLAAPPAGWTAHRWWPCSWTAPTAARRWAASARCNHRRLQGEALGNMMRTEM